MSSELVREFADGETVPGTRYRVIGMIGAGGMGSVYDVEHTELGKRFVLKALLRELSRRKDLVARLRQEWRALARLEHPCIVNVTDAGTSGNGVPFYVMERLDGETLSDRLRRDRRLPVTEALMVAAGVLDGLSAAHEIGIVHRDVKPPNIFLLAGGGVKLLDFGIAKIASSSAEVITARGVAIGTPRYMSPEQARGDRVDGRADLYAAGLILFEMIAGRGPFDDVSEANKLLLAHLSQVPPRLASLVAGVPAELDQIVASLLEKDPRARPPSARRVAEALRQIAVQLGAVVPVAGASYPPPVPGGNYPPPARASAPPARPSGPPVEQTRPASPRASAQFDATIRLPPDATVPSARLDATVPSGPPGGDTTVLDPKRTVRMDEMGARRSDPPRAGYEARRSDPPRAAAPELPVDATSTSLPDWHPGAGQAAPGGLPASVQAAPVDRTLTLEELGERPRPVEEPPPTRTAVPAAALGGETPPPVESERPPSIAGTPARGAGLAVALGLAALVTLGVLGVGAWLVIGSRHTADAPLAASAAAPPSARVQAVPSAVVPAAPASAPASAAPGSAAPSALAAAASAAPSAASAAAPPVKAPAKPAAKPAPSPATAPPRARPAPHHAAPHPHPIHHATVPPAGLPGSGL